jgi:hypothetical protein
MSNSFRASTSITKALAPTVLMWLLLSTFVNAQKIEIAWVQVEGKQLVVHYDLDDTNPTHEYIIQLFTSKDNYTTPLTKISGDAGSEVKAGKDKKLIWSITEELGNYAGEIELEIRGKVYVPFIKLSPFEKDQKFKRGINYPLVWHSGNLSGQVDIELYFENTRIHSDRNVPNTGKFDWIIPGNIKPGKGYHLKFTNTKNRDEILVSTPFRITPKIQTLYKIAAGVLIGTGIILFMPSGSGPSDPVEEDLPSHPTTPNQGG